MQSQFHATARKRNSSYYLYSFTRTVNLTLEIELFSTISDQTTLIAANLQETH